MIAPHPIDCCCLPCRAGALRLTFVDPLPDVEKRYCADPSCGIRLARSNRSRLCYLHSAMEQRRSLQRELRGVCCARGCDRRPGAGNLYCSTCSRTRHQALMGARRA